MKKKADETWPDRHVQENEAVDGVIEGAHYVEDVRLQDRKHNI